MLITASDTNCRVCSAKAPKRCFDEWPYFHQCRMDEAAEVNRGDDTDAILMKVAEDLV